MPDRCPPALLAIAIAIACVAPASAEELNDDDWLAEELSLADASSIAQLNAGARDSLWAEYLDLAYIYTSAPQDALKARLDEYGQEAGMTLEQYLDPLLRHEPDLAEINRHCNEAVLR